MTQSEMPTTAAGVDQPAAPAAPASGVLTFLFTDLVSSTELLAAVGETRMEALREAHFELLRRQVAACGGREVKSLGDGLMVVFTSPTDAIACAVAMQRAVDRRNRSRAESMSVRIGIEIGETTLQEDDYFGGPVILAKRLCDAAEGGQVLVSALVRALAAPRSAHRLGDPTTLQLKGWPEPTIAYGVDWQRSVTPSLPPPPALTCCPELSRFVGRRAEWQRLDAALGRVAAGRRGLALLAGEPGIGKTRLAVEFSLHVREAGGVVLWGRSTEDVRIPYEPFVEALRHYVTHCPTEDLHQQAGADAAVLARLVPELAERLPGSSTTTGGDTEAERFRLFNAVSSLLSTIASGVPLLLVLDDLQWADQASLLLLRYLMREPDRSSLLVLGTYRETEVTRSHPLVGVISDLRREQLCDEVALGGLAQLDVAQLVDSLTGWEPTPAFARTLRDETQGNALFVEEVVRHLQDTGAVSAEGPAATAPDLADTGVPDTVRDVLWKRLRRLPPETVELLGVASVIGPEFTVDLLSLVAPAQADRAVPLLDEAVTTGLLKETDRLGRYRFAHALVQHALHEEHTLNRRAWLHAHVAEAMERLYADDLPPHYAELASHYARAGQVLASKVVGFARAAGERALELLAYEDAQGACTTALRALDVWRPDDHALRADLLVLLGTAQLRSGDAAAAQESFRTAAAHARQAPSPLTLARAALGYGSLAGFGGVWSTFAAVDDVLVGLLEDALAGGGLDDLHRARVLGRLAQALYWSAEKERMRDLSQEALTIARQASDDTALAYALDSRHVSIWDPAHLEERRSLAEEMLRLGRSLHDRDIQLEAYAWLITDVLEQGPIASVREHVEAHARLAQELHQPYYLWYTAAARAMLAHLEGRFADMERLAEEAWGHGEQSHAANAMQTHLVQTLFLRREQGRLGDFVDGLAVHVAQSPLVYGWHAALAVACAEDGRESQARAELDRLGVDGFTTIPQDCIWMAVVSMLSEVVGRFDVTEHAEPLLRLLLPIADRTIVVGGAVLCFGPATHALGILSRVMGDHERALEYFESAIAASLALESPPLVARIQVEEARTLHARGDGDDVRRAARLLDEATATAQSLGMVKLLDDITAVAGARGPRQLTGTGRS